MKTYVINSKSVSDERSFYQAYLGSTHPEGVAIFGCNREAFRDAVLGGGPGWPGECEIVIISSARLRMIDGGRFHKFLGDLASESSLVRFSFE
jgi:ribonuclease inhibitor